MRCEGRVRGYIGRGDKYDLDTIIFLSHGLLRRNSCYEFWI